MGCEIGELRAKYTHLNSKAENKTYERGIRALISTGKNIEKKERTKKRKLSKLTLLGIS
jgi:hypothetical protein